MPILAGQKAFVRLLWALFFFLNTHNTISQAAPGLLLNTEKLSLLSLQFPRSLSPVTVHLETKWKEAASAKGQDGKIVVQGCEAGSLLLLLQSVCASVSPHELR